MKSFLNLKIVISVLTLALLKEFLFLFTPPTSSPLEENTRYALTVLLNIYFLSFLFLYVTRVKQQKLSLIPFVVLILISVYFFIMKLTPVSAEPEQISYIDSASKTIWKTAIPACVSIIMQIIVAFQLLNNTCAGASKNKLKLVGFSLLLTIVLSWMVPALNYQVTFEYFGQLFALIYMLPLLAYLNFYYFESKNTTDSSEIVF